VVLFYAECFEGLECFLFFGSGDDEFFACGEEGDVGFVFFADGEEVGGVDEGGLMDAKEAVWCEHIFEVGDGVGGYEPAVADDVELGAGVVCCAIDDVGDRNAIVCFDGGDEDEGGGRCVWMVCHVMYDLKFIGFKI